MAKTFNVLKKIVVI